MLITDLKEVQVAIFQVFEKNGNKLVKFESDIQEAEGHWIGVDYSWFEVPIEECIERGAMNIFNEDGSEYTQYQCDYNFDGILDDDDAREIIINLIDESTYEYIENARQFDDLACGNYLMPWSVNKLSKCYN